MARLQKWHGSRRAGHLRDNARMFFVKPRTPMSLACPLNASLPHCEMGVETQRDEGDLWISGAFRLPGRGGEHAFADAHLLRRRKRIERFRRLDEMYAGKPGPEALTHPLPRCAGAYKPA